MPWYTHAIFYQIYPWSFKDSNGDGIGDIEGIISKLDYLAGTPESLGITALWLSPINTSPMKDFGYDISDYYAIDERFGSLADFARLIKEAHKRGIRVIMDLVTNHTSSKHPWFIEAQSSKDNPKRDWYIWKDPVNGDVPNNWLSVPGNSAWTISPQTGQYYLHQFLPDQPDLNWRNPEVRSEFKKIMEFWISRGVDGFRVDAMSHLIEHESFKDEPSLSVPGKKLFGYSALSHIYSKDQPELTDIIKFFSEIAHQHKDIFIVNEAYLPLDGMVQFYNSAPYHNEAPFNFNLISLPWDAQAYRAFIDVFERAVKTPNVKLYVLGNHDLPRLATRIGVENITLAATLLLTLPGSPFIYYGEELGMTHAEISKEDIRDGFAFSTGKGTPLIRDGARTPMQWTPKSEAGFSTSKPWLPINKENLEHINVESEIRNPTSLFNLYRTLITLRKNSPTLQKGTYRGHTTRSPEICAYTRQDETATFLIMLNFSEDMITEQIPENMDIVMNTYQDDKTNLSDTYTIILRPKEGVILKSRKS